MKGFELQKPISQLFSAIKNQYFECEFLWIGPSEQSIKVHNFRKILFVMSSLLEPYWSGTTTCSLIWIQTYCLLQQLCLSTAVRTVLSWLLCLFQWTVDTWIFSKISKDDINLSLSILPLPFYDPSGIQSHTSFGISWPSFLQQLWIVSTEGWCGYVEHRADISSVNLSLHWCRSTL